MRRPELERFVNRGAPLRILETALLQLDAGESKVIVFHGVGGQGKSLLLRKFRQQLATDPSYSHVRPAFLDLSLRRERDPWRPPLWIRNELVEHGVRFPAFDLGFELYWADTYPEQASPFLRRRWLRRATDATAISAGELATTVTAEGMRDVLASVPFVGLAVAKLGRIAFQAGMREYLLSTNDALQALFREGRLIPSAQLLTHLPFLLASDLRTHVARHPECRFVVFIDEYERCLEHGGSTDQRRDNPFDSMTQDLVSECAATLFVIAGRERLHWPAEHAEWSAALDGQQHHLDGLSRDDASAVLRLEGIEDAALIDAMVEGATAAESELDVCPVYPLLLDLQVEHWVSLRSAGKPVRADDFTIGASGFAQKRAQMLRRLMRDYEPPFRALMARLAVARWFDRRLFDDLVRLTASGISIDAWEAATALSFVRRGPRGSFVMHQAIREGLTAELSEDAARASHAWLAGHFDNRARVEDPRAVTAVTIAALEEVLYHRLNGNPADLASWVRRVAQPLWQAGRRTDLERLCRRGWQQLESTFGTLHPDTLFAASYCCAALANIGHAAEARDRLREIVAAFDESGTEETEESLLIRSGLGVALWHEGKFVDALPLQQRVVDGRTRLLGSEHEATVGARLNLAMTAAELGEHEEGAVLCDSVLTVLHATVGPDHARTLDALAVLAWIRGKQEQHEECLILHRRVLDGRERILGPEHPDTLTSVEHVAAALDNLDRSEEATQLQRRVQDGRQRILGPDHPDTLRGKVLLAVMVGKLGHLEEAAGLLRAALAARERILGSDHLETIEAMSHLAFMLSRLEREEEATVLKRRILDARRRVLGPEHPDTLRILASLGVSVGKAGDYAEAADLEREALDARERVLGSEHPDTLSVMHNLAISLSCLGRHEEALDLERRLLDVRTRTLGAEHESTVRTRSSLALTLGRLGQHEEAARLHRHVLGTRERLFGSAHHDTLATKDNLAAVLAAMGHHAEAAVLLREVVAAREIALGNEHPDTLRPMKALAASILELGHVEDAVQLARRAANALERVVGPEHDDTLSSLATLVVALRRSGQLTDADEVELRLHERPARSG